MPVDPSPELFSPTITIALVLFGHFVLLGLPKTKRYLKSVIIWEVCLICVLVFLGMVHVGVFRGPVSSVGEKEMEELRRIIREGVFYLLIGLPFCVFVFAYIFRPILNRKLAANALIEAQKSARQKEVDRLQSEKAAENKKNAEFGASRQAANEQLRRNRARADCERLYLIAAPEIGDRFPRDQFDAFVTKHLPDTYDAVTVEDHAEQLKVIIAEHKKAVDRVVQETRNRKEERHKRRAEAERFVYESERQPPPPGETLEERAERLRILVDLLRETGRSDDEIRERLKEQRKTASGEGKDDPIDENELYNN